MADRLDVEMSAVTYADGVTAGSTDGHFHQLSEKDHVFVVRSFQQFVARLHSEVSIRERARGRYRGQESSTETARDERSHTPS